MQRCSAVRGTTGVTRFAPAESTLLGGLYVRHGSQTEHPMATKRAAKYACYSRTDTARRRACRVPWQSRPTPPDELSLWWQRLPVGGMAADQIATRGDHSLAAFRPERRDDVGRSCALVKAAEDCPLDVERIRQSEDIASND